MNKRSFPVLSSYYEYICVIDELQILFPNSFMMGSKCGKDLFHLQMYITIISDFVNLWYYRNPYPLQLGRVDKHIK